MNQSINPKIALGAVIAGALVLFVGVFVGTRLDDALSIESVEDKERRISGDPPATTTAKQPAQGSASGASAARKPSCEETVRTDAEAKGLKYEKGSILVTFRSGTSFSEAKSFLDARGLRVHTGASPQEFESSQWLTVTVPKGEEFGWICALRKESEITYAGINPTFDLAQ